LRGGRHAGRVRVAAAEGEYVIERMLDRPARPRITRPDGAGAEAGDLERLLGGADARLFGAVFACGLDDLVALTAGDAGAVRERLISASLTGAGRSARAAIRTLREQAAERLSGEGAARISTLIAELEALRPRLNAARRAALAYSERRAAAIRARSPVEPLRAAHAARRARNERDLALLTARPAWDELQGLRAALAVLAPAVVPPPDVDAEIAAARQRLSASQREAQALRAEHAEAERQARTQQAEATARAAAELESLRADLALHRYHLGTQPAARARCEEAERARRERLHRLGPDWDLERLQEWSRSGADRDAVRDWQARMRAASERVEQARWRLDAAAVQHATLAREIAMHSAVDLPSATELDDRRRALGEARALLTEMLERRGRGEATAHTLHERERALRALDAEATPPPPGWLPAGLLGGAAAAAAGSVGAVMTARPELAVLLVSAAAASVFSGRRMQRLARWHETREQEREMQRRTLRSELESARRSRDADWHRAAELAEHLASAAAALGLARGATAADIDAADRLLVERMAERERRHAEQARAAELEPLRRQAEADEQARRVELEAARSAEQALAAEWRSWCSAVGLPPGSDAAAALERAVLVESALGAQAAADTATRELHQVEPLVAAWEARARALLRRIGDLSGAALGGEALIARVSGPLAVETVQAAQLPEADWQQRQERMQAAEADLARCAATLQGLLQAAGVRDEADLAERRRRHEQRLGLERDIALRERLLAERLPSVELLGELGGDPAEWRARLDDAEADIGVLERRLAQAEAEAQRAEQACRALEESAEVPSLELEWDGLMTELAGAVREWRVLAVADGLIDAARNAYEQSRQPAVLREASRIFASVTAGRYVRITQDEQGEGLVVLERDDRVRRVGAELSRGTLEQLYLSLRLGLAADFARRGTSLPMVLDDVLVNFDPERARAMARTLGAFAREHQLLFFTCHPSMRDLLALHAVAARVVELGSEIGHERYEAGAGDLP
jgi:uncharacterized protein YhaN